MDWVHRWWTTGESHGPLWTGSGTLIGVGLRPLQGTVAHQRGWEMESGKRGSHFRPHRGSGGDVVAGRWR
jgi:hypothetical protein